MNQKDPQYNYPGCKTEHFLKKEMIKMDINKPAVKPKHEVKYIRLLDDEIYLPSSPPSTKHQAFLNIARNQMLNMDAKRKDFLKKAAKKMVRDVLSQEFGEDFMDDKGFAKMEETITNKLLHTPNYREVLKKLLGMINTLQSDTSSMSDL